MSCGEFQQVRLADFLHVSFTDDEDGKSTLVLSDALDIGGGREIVVTVLATNVSLASGGTSIELLGMTAAINNEAYYGATADDPIALTALPGGKPTVFVGKFTTLSRFWFPKFRVAGSPDGESSLSCTIDAVIR